jgi:hypothetical protein
VVKPWDEAQPAKGVMEGDTKINRNPKVDSFGEVGEILHAKK